VTGDIALRTHYWDDARAKAAFKHFALDIHGLDFTAWDSAGFWDEAYTPFSFFQGEIVVASVCIYLLNFVVSGEPTCLAQVSAVGTLPDWRRRGLNRQLTEIGLKWAQGRHDGVFLFADDDAVPFYLKCGFQPQDEFVEEAPAVPVATRRGAVRLDPGNKTELGRIHAYAKRRVPVSSDFGVLNDRLFMFHVLYTPQNDIYEISDLNCLIVCRRSGDRLRVYDIVGERIPLWEELYSYIADPADRALEFHFRTDRLGLDETVGLPLEGNHPFVLRPFPVTEPVFPYTCRA